MSLIAFDIGGTKVAAAIIEKNEIKNVLVENTKIKKEEFLNQLFSCIEKLRSKTTTAICMGMPGVIKNNVLMQRVSNIPFLYEINLKKEIERRYHLPVFIENDALCFVLGEKYFGKAKAYQNVAGVILGTGFGLGLIINEKSYRAPQTKCGEFGNLAFKDKTLEDYCSGKFFLWRYGEKGEILSQRAHAGDIQARKALESFGEHLGKALQLVLDRFPLQSIILGGSITNDFSFFEKSMRQQMKKNILIQPWSNQNIALLGASCLLTT
ncbi:ROK family protein [Candidatus Woesearchaeota archaeon]|nr:ROK family protein [Candidatus Woesearchaeota archaeon]